MLFLRRVLLVAALLISMGARADRAEDYHWMDSLQRAVQKFDETKQSGQIPATVLADTTKANLIYEFVRLMWAYSPDTALKYSQQVLQLSQCMNYIRGIGNAYNGMGLAYMKFENADSARKYFKIALNIRQQIGDKAGMAWTYNNLGTLMGGPGDYAQVIYYHTQAIKLREELKDTDNLRASYSKRGTMYCALGDFASALKDFLAADNVEGVAGVYASMGDYQNAYASYLKNLERSVRIAREQNRLTADQDVAVSYMHLWTICDQMGDTALANKYYNEFIKRQKDLIYGFRIEEARLHLGQWAFKKGNYPDAIKNLNQAYYMAAHGHNVQGQSSYMNELAGVYFQLKDYKKALALQDSGIILAQSVKANNLLQAGYSRLAEIYRARGDFKSAFKNEVLFKQYSDSVYNGEVNRKLARAQLEYDFGRQEDSIKTEAANRDVLARQKMQKQKIYTAFGGGGFILASLLLFFVYRSYTSQRRANAALAMAKLRAEESEKFKEQFLANMSHEIRTPMSAVLGMTNLLLDTPLNEKQNNYLRAVKKSSENLLVILNDILDLSKLEAGKMELEKKAFDIRAQIAQSTELMGFKAGDKGLQFMVEVAEDMPAVVVGDAGRLNQVLINLLGNAIKFTEKGFVTLSVKGGPATNDKSRKLIFSIRDSGIGMSAAQQKGIFESFVQGESDTSRKYGGTGLGLTISKTLIERQQGTITVQSQPGTGSEFTFTIPYEIGREEDIINGQQMHETDYTSLCRLKILVAEDNEFNQIVIKDTLENLLPGVAVDIAANGKIACEKVEHGFYDIVLMDVLMPEMDGHSATRYIRNQLRSNIPVVALTASLIRSDLDKCTEAGMSGYVPKPFTRDELLTELMRYSGKN